MKPILSVLATSALVAAGILGAGIPAQATPGQTYTVTSPALCGGAGTFEQAVKDANAHPGHDTIAFTAGMSVELNSCARVISYDIFPIVATEAVDILGNGAKVWGNQYWVDMNGNVNNFLMCPVRTANSNWISHSTGFLEVGRMGQDNTGVDVTISGLAFDNLPTLVQAWEKSSITMNDSTATNINAFEELCDRPAITGIEANITLKGMQIAESNAPGRDSSEGTLGAFIAGVGGNLVVDRVALAEIFYAQAISWRQGTTPSSVKIVSSPMLDSGGLRLDATTSEIVNSAYYTQNTKASDRIVSNVGATTIKASTFYWRTPVCEPNCGVNGMGFWAPLTGTFAFNSTAIGANSAYPNSGPVLFGDISKFSSDSLTWVQETPNQTNAELQMILPSVLTGVPGLTAAPTAPSWIDIVTPMLGTQQQPGVLVDAVVNADCPAGANALLNPIDNTCITSDVFGKPRWDAGNNKRNIGAVQNAESPVLSLDPAKPPTATTISLIWNRPSDPASGPITGYNIYCAPVAGGVELSYFYPGPANLSATISGLTTGTPYRCQAVGVNQVGPGPRSNVVVGTPVGPIAPPVVTVRPGNGKASVAWTEPDAGGHPGPLGYFVQYRKVGDPTWLTGPSVSGRIVTIPDLVNRTDYEFGVVAVSPDQAFSTPIATATGTPRGDMFVPIDPARAYDSRISGGPLNDGTSRTVSVAGQIPVNATAVAYNITVTDMNGPGYLTVTPGDVVNPPVSSTINWDGPGELIANGIVVGVDDQRKINVFSGLTGSPTFTHFVIDVVGYYMPVAESPAGNVFVPVDPVRAYDSRNAQGILMTGQSRTVDLAAQTGGTLPDGVTAVAYNLTSTDGVGQGYLTVAPASVVVAPVTSTINWWGPGQVIANGIDVKVDPAKKVNVFAGGPGGSQFVIDIVGYFAPLVVAPTGTGFSAVTPTRAYDSRTQDGPIFGSQERNISMATGGLVPTGAAAVAYNLPITDTVSTRYLTVTPGSVATPPNSSTINWWQTGQILSNGIAVGIDANRSVNVFSGPANGARTNFVLDTVGYYN